MRSRSSRRHFLLRAAQLGLASTLAACAPSTASLVISSKVALSGEFLALEAKPPLKLLHSNLPVPEPTLDMKIGQMLLTGFRGQFLSENSRVLGEIRDYHIGGVVLFGGNVSSPDQVQTLTQTLQDAAAHTLLIAIDQEGGQVMRLDRRFGITTNYSAQALGQMNDMAKTTAEAELFAQTLASLGINLNLAPVVDLNLNPYNPVIGALGRSFSADPAIVTSQAKTFIEAHHKYNTYCTLKHFPGHGSSHNDTHWGFVDVTDSWKESELAPYHELIKAGACDVIMTAHIFNGKLDAKLPATLSQAIVTGILRERLGYDGVVISDDMQMRAISKYYDFPTAIQFAIEAGIDILAIANNVAYQETVAIRAAKIIRGLVDSGKISEARINQSYERIMRLKAGLPAPTNHS